MIIARITSGLGNQMFQYAMAKSVAIHLGCELKLDITGYDRKDNYIERKFQLNYFNTELKIATTKEINNLINKKSKLPGLLRNILKQPKYYSGEYKEKQIFLFDENVFNVMDNTYFSGYWINEKYFKNIKDEILKNFTLKDSFDEKNLKFSEKIQKTNAVSLHIRRGDFINNPDISKRFNVCDLDYYKKAVRIICEKINDPHFFVFSDDLIWVKENLKLSYPMTFVDCNNEFNAYLDLMLMSKCKHHIIPNSSFSWWSAWLNPSDKKIVIASKIWLNGETPGNLQNIGSIPEDWIII